MRQEEAISAAGLGLISGYVGMLVMEPVSMKLYEVESEVDRRREDEVRPGAPYEIATKKLAEAIGLQLEEKQVQTIGMSWGVAYTLLRRLTGINPVAGGLVTGAAMSLLGVSDDS
jgi:hypothetical protein